MNLRPSRRILLFLCLVCIGLLIFVAIFFQPQKLFIDEEVNDAAPTNTVPAPDTTSSDKNSDGSDSNGKAEFGEFRGLDHSATGRAAILLLSDGKRVLRFEDLDTENGPDLRVYLSTASSDSSDDDAFAEDYLDLGALRGNQGDQNYVIPADTDIDRYKSAVIWCRRFSVGFAVAPIS